MTALNSRLGFCPNPFKHKSDKIIQGEDTRQVEAIQAVRSEKKLETAMVGQRMFDPRRWGNAKEVMNAYFENDARTISNFAQKVNPYEDKHNMLPIPQQAIDLSGGVLDQNPGY